jgi:hypothetical protein
MSDEHKAALAQGREEGRIVRRYLEALEQNRPRRGRRRTPESIRQRLASIEERLESADALTRLHLLQERTNLQEELERTGGTEDDLEELEEAFVKVAKAYGERKNVSYSTWRAAGVQPSTLQRAGIPRHSA